MWPLYPGAPFTIINEMTFHGNNYMHSFVSVIIHPFPYIKRSLVKLPLYKMDELLRSIVLWGRHSVPVP